MNSDNLKKNKLELKIKFIFIFLAACVILLISIWPESYIFSTPKDSNIIQRLIHSPIHLHDDVMISLRSGYILNKIGIPSFNISDLSQPSTSYFAPYLYSFLIKLFPKNLSIIIYSFLGFISVLLTFSIIIFNSKSTLNGILTIIGFVISSTSINFTLLGWDYLFQTFFLLLGVYLYFNENSKKFKFILIGIILAFSFLWRADGIIIASSILFLIGMEGLKSRKILNFLYAVIPFISIIIPFLISNYLSFGYFTPTTARLKIGASPSWKYSFDYFLNNTILDFSVITIFLTLVIVYLSFLNGKKNYQTNLIFLAACATSFIASLNSDVFIGGRMYWASACTLGFIICKKADSLIKVYDFNLIFLKNFFNGLIFSFLILSIFFSTLGAFKNKYSKSAISLHEVNSSYTASQFAVTKWINNNLNPEDGSIGIFFLGISYHLENFSIADFLGKADEKIAQSNIRQGPPGHNKWNIYDSLDKWNPQAILPPNPLIFINKDTIKDAKINLNNKNNIESFSDSLYGNKRILKNYSFCFINPNVKGHVDTWGLLIRNDILLKNNQTASCRQFK